jgi:hypothetical protein
VPTDIGVPNSSASSPAVRSTGRCWPRHRCTAIAAACDRYCTGADTPAGAAAAVTAPHPPQRRLISWCSTTRTVIFGMSNTCRRTILAGELSATSAEPQPARAPGSCPTTSSAARPGAACAPPGPADRPAGVRTGRAAISAPACPAPRSTAAWMSCARRRPAAVPTPQSARPARRSEPAIARSSAPAPPRVWPAARRTERSRTDPSHPQPEHPLTTRRREPEQSPDRGQFGHPATPNGWPRSARSPMSRRARAPTATRSPSR